MSCRMRMHRLLYRTLPIMALLAQAALTTGCPLIAGIAFISAIDLSADRQTMGRKVDDSAIEIRINQSFNTDPELKQHARIKVTTVQGLVLLVGEAPNTAAALRATRIARDTPEVEEVINKITIGEILSDAGQNREALLVARAKGRMIRRAGLNAARVNIVGHHDILYLMGLVTEEEGASVADSIRRVKGVSRIVKIFQYVQVQ